MVVFRSPWDCLGEKQVNLWLVNGKPVKEAATPTYRSTCTHLCDSL